MPKVKITMLSLLAVLVLSAAASAAASAATHQWLIEGTPLATGSKVEVQGNSLPYAQEGQLEATVGSAHIYCQTAILPSGAANVFEGGNIGKGKAKIEFTGCGVFTVTAAGVSVPLPECKIEKEPIVAEAEGELTASGILVLKGIGGAALSTFGIVKTNKEAVCAVEAKGAKVEGSQTCVKPHFSVALYIHVVECTPGGSSLTLLGEPARLYLGYGQSLEKGSKWSSS